MTVDTTCEAALADETTVERGLFQIEIRRSSSCDVVALTGGISLEAADQLRDAALQAMAPGREVAVDWSEATLVSGGALQVLLALRAALDARGLTLSVTGDNPGVRRMLELAGLSSFFPVQEHAG